MTKQCWRFECLAGFAPRSGILRRFFCGTAGEVSFLRSSIMFTFTLSALLDSCRYQREVRGGRREHCTLFRGPAFYSRSGRLI